MLDSHQSAELLKRVSRSDLTGRELRDYAMQALSELEGYDWCGIYRLEGSELVLDAFVGAPTDHDRIPIGRGVCGTAVATGENQIVSDVSDLDNYLSCSLETKAEIVVLIRDQHGLILGQIDIDSHRGGWFNSFDEAILIKLANLLALQWT